MSREDRNKRRDRAPHSGPWSVESLIEAGLLSADESSRFTDAVARRAPAAIRLRTLQGTGSSKDAFFPTADPVPWHPRGRLLDVGSRPGSRLAFAAGEYYVQDAGSLLATALVEAQPGERVCDLCAAPGGKSTAILEDLGTAGWLLANEPIHSRRPALELNLARHGSARYVVTGVDPSILAESLAGQFDAVLVDAPCSGQTLAARGRAPASTITLSQIEHCAARQSRILDAAAQLVRPGGRLVYSTCTFAMEENERQGTAFLERHPGWIPFPSVTLCEWMSPVAVAAYRLWPHRHSTAGTFAMRFVRTNGSEVATRGFPALDEPPSGNSSDIVSLKARRGNHSHRVERARSSSNSISRIEPAELPDEFPMWGELDRATICGDSQRCFAWPDDVPTAWLAVACGGPEAAYRKGSTWFPSYSLAMRRDANWRPRLLQPLNSREAAAYVCGESISMSLQQWGIATWRGLPLGWMKGSGGLARNHLPKPARLTAISPEDMSAEG